MPPLMPPRLAHRPIVLGRGAMIAAGHPQAAWIGAKVLSDGGNAVDAMVAAGAALAVLRPHMSGLGGDALTLIYLARERRLVALQGMGWAPAAATTEWFRAQGMDQVPRRGLLSPTIPGCVDAWISALDRYGTKPFASLLQPAVVIAEEGFPVSPSLAEDLMQALPILEPHAGSRAVFLPNGRPLAFGELLVQKDLAASLRGIAQGGRGAFYQGRLAEAIGTYCETHGGLIRAADFSQGGSQWVEPIETSYRGLQVVNVPPPSQGITLLAGLNILEGYTPSGAHWADWIHLQVEIKKLAFADRDRFVADPDRVTVPVAGLLSKQFARERCKAIDRRHAAEAQSPGHPWERGGETTYLAIVDREGNAVSHIQSIFRNFGSGVVVEGTGILLNNRLNSFRLDEGANQLGPHKRPLHTLNAPMLLRDGRPYLVIGTPGAHGQVQILLQVLSYCLDYGMTLQEAIECPRWHHDADTGTLEVEERFPPVLRRTLERRGHRLDVKPAWNHHMGGVQAILVDPQTRVLAGAADPRREGYAIGW
ncbi:MAG: gamma-glutamyltransferase [Candidatus Methylomirabilales bacterium]